MLCLKIEELFANITSCQLKKKKHYKMFILLTHIKKEGFKF